MATSFIRFTCWVAFLFLALSTRAHSEYACIEELPNGTSIKRQQAIPKKWFNIDGKSILDPKTHSELKKKFGKQYVSHKNPEGYSGSLCLKGDAGYIEISTNSFGVGMRFSKTVGRCQTKCFTADADVGLFRIDSGLQLGQTKEQVTSLIGESVKNDISEISFEEKISKSGKFKYHLESLRLEFENEVLIRFMVFDYQEDD